MAIYNLDEDDRREIRLTAPICVIGAGVAGLLLAQRLAAAGQAVIVIESGLEAFDAEIHALNELENVDGHYQGALTGRRRGLGGSSVNWGGGLVPLTPHDIGPRPYLSLPGWPLSSGELEAYQPEIDRIFRLDASSFEEDLLESVDRQGSFPRRDQDFTCRWLKLATPESRNLATFLRRRLPVLPKLDVWLGATVKGFDLDEAGGRIMAIKAGNLAGRSLTVRADAFVFAAGTIETTRLLLLLDRTSRERAFAGCRVLGRYFQDHLDAEIGQLCPMDRKATSHLFGVQYASTMRRLLHLELTPSAQRADTVASAFVHITADLDEHRSVQALKRLMSGARGLSSGQIRSTLRGSGDLVRIAYWRWMRHRLFLPKGVGLKLRACIEQVPHWTNRICLSNEPDRLGTPRARLEWQPTDVEERTFRACIARLTAYWRRAGFDEVCPIAWSEAATDPSSPLTDQAQDWAHPSGTTRMGTDPQESVVGSDLRCHHIANASVVSASTFPTAGASNPTLTIIQLALRHADALKAHSGGRA